MKEWLLELLRCPVCYGTLEVEGEMLVCECKESYPIFQDIPVFTENGRVDAEIEQTRGTENEPTQIPTVRRLCSKHSSALNLDVGCGTGRNLNQFSGRLVGCDVDLESLIQAKRRAAKNQKDAGFVCADAVSLPFPADIFSFVLSSEVIEHIPLDERDSFAEELYRVAESNARVVVTAPIKNPFADGLAEVARLVGFLDERSSETAEDHPRIRIEQLSDLGFSPHGCLDAPAWTSLQSRGLTILGEGFDGLAWHIPYISTHAVGVARQS